MDRVRRKKLILVIAAAVLLAACLALSVTAGFMQNYSSVQVDPSLYSVGNIAFDDENNRVVIATDDKKLVAVDMTTGEEAWRKELPERVSTMTISHGTAFYTFSGKRDVYWTDSAGNSSVEDVLDADGNVVTPGNTFQTASGYPIVGIAVSEKSSCVAVVSAQDMRRTRVDIFRDFDSPRSSVTIAAVATPVFVAINDSNGVVYYMNNNSVLYSCDEKRKVSVEAAEVNFVAAGMGFTATGDFAVCDGKGVLSLFDSDMNPTGSMNLGGDVYAFSTNPMSDYGVAATKSNRAVVVNVTERRVAGSTKIFSETSKVSVSKDGNVALVQGLNKLGILFNVADLPLLQFFQISVYIFAPLAAIFAVLLLIAVLRMSERGTAALKRFWGGVMYALKKYKRCYLVMIPTFALLLLFNYYPVVWSFKLAFSDYVPGVHDRFIGWKNFQDLFQLDYFWKSIGNMLLFLVTDIVKGLVPPIFFAELIRSMKSEKGKYFIRLMLFVPGILPGLAGVLIWTQGILGNDGLINVIFRALGLGGWAQNWLGQSNTAMGALIFIGFPYIGAYLLFYGALLSVPPSLDEAAKIDGCGWMHRIISIDLPMIAAQIKYVFITGFIGSVQDFGRVYMTTGGGPGTSTYIPSLVMYMNLSIMHNNGLAAAIGLLLFIVIFGATLLFLKFRSRETA